MMMGLKLNELCVHCGDELVIYFRRDIGNRGQLQCAVVHEFYQTNNWIWKDLHGFEDLTQINGPKDIQDWR